MRAGSTACCSTFRSAVVIPNALSKVPLCQGWKIPRLSAGIPVSLITGDIFPRRSGSPIKIADPFRYVSSVTSSIYRVTLSSDLSLRTEVRGTTFAARLWDCVCEFFFPIQILRFPAKLNTLERSSFLRIEGYSTLELPKWSKWFICNFPQKSYTGWAERIFFFF